MVLKVPKGYFIPEVVRRSLVVSPDGSGYIGVGVEDRRVFRNHAVQIVKLTTGFPNTKATYRARFNHMEEWQDFDNLQTLVTVMCAKHRMFNK